MEKELEKLQLNEIYIIPAKIDNADIAAKLTFKLFYRKLLE
jgi:hypothetical protein